MPKQKLDFLLQREVSREEFIKYMAVALLSVIGIAGFMRNLHQTLPSTPKLNRGGSGYGSNPYGR